MPQPAALVQRPARDPEQHVAGREEDQAQCAPSMVNAVYSERGNWAGSHAQLWDQARTASAQEQHQQRPPPLRARHLDVLPAASTKELFASGLPTALAPSSPDADLPTERCCSYEHQERCHRAPRQQNARRRGSRKARAAPISDMRPRDRATRQRRARLTTTFADPAHATEEMRAEAPL